MRELRALHSLKYPQNPRGKKRAWSAQEWYVAKATTRPSSLKPQLQDFKEELGTGLKCQAGGAWIRGYQLLGCRGTEATPSIPERQRNLCLGVYLLSKSLYEMAVSQAMLTLLPVHGTTSTTKPSREHVHAFGGSGAQHARGPHCWGDFTGTNVVTTKVLKPIMHMSKIVPPPPCESNTKVPRLEKNNIYRP